MRQTPGAPGPANNPVPGMPRTPPPIPTPTVENYLKAIYAHSRGSGMASMGALAAELGVTPGTVTTMVRRLTQSGLARYEKYAGVGLTPAGRKAALSVVRRHRLIETFLVETLGLDWAEVHDEAERLEHALSPVVIEALDRFLGRPRVDPHGEPIPDAGGRIRERDLVPLAGVRSPARFRVAQIADDSSAFLRFAGRHGLRPGARGNVRRVDRASDTLEIQVDGHPGVAVSFAVAGKILATIA